MKEKITLTTWFIIIKKRENENEKRTKKFPYAEKLRTITLSLLLATDVNNMIFFVVAVVMFFYFLELLFLGTATNNK